VTASHNPPQDNGFKPVFSGARPISAETGLREMAEIFQDNNFEEQKGGGVEKKKLSMTIFLFMAVMKIFKILN